jgi:hypothetical protein
MFDISTSCLSVLSDAKTKKMREKIEIPSASPTLTNWQHNPSYKCRNDITRRKKKKAPSVHSQYV